MSDRRLLKLASHAAKYGMRAANFLTQAQQAQSMALVRGSFQQLLSSGWFVIGDTFFQVHSIDNPIYSDPGRDGILLPALDWKVTWSGVDHSFSPNLFFDIDHTPNGPKVTYIRDVIENGSLIGEYVEIENLYSWNLAMDERWRESAQRKKKVPICGAFWRQRSAHCRLESGHTGSHQGRSKGGLFTYIWTDEDMIHKRQTGTTTLTGWRVWKCVKGPRLKSVTADREWDSPVMRTKPGTVPASWLEETTGYTQSDGHQLPHPTNKETHDYGVYAYKTPLLCWEKLLQHDRERDHYTRTEPQYLVIGRMDLSGIVVEHELGYRAEIAVIQELWYVSNDFADALGEGQRRVRELSEFYKCDVHLLAPNQIHGWAKWYTDGEEKS